MPTIEELNIKIMATSQKSANGIDALTTSLGKLKRATNVKGIESLKAKLTGLQSAIAPLSADAGTKLSNLAKGLSDLASVPKQTISATTAKQISSIGQVAQSLSGTDFTPLTHLASGLTSLASVQKSNLTATVANNIRAVGEAVRSLDGADYENISKLAIGLTPLETIGKSNLGSALNQLKKIPEITNALNSQTLAKFGVQIRLVTKYIQPLAAEMEKVSNGFSKLPANIQRSINANAKLTASNRSAHSSYKNLGSILTSVKAKLVACTYVIRKAFTWIGNWVRESNDYVENLNLFTVAMGQYTNQAKAYAEKVEGAFGIDSSEFMRYQAVFQNMATGFGLASEKAEIMSRNLVQIGYDLSSLYNVDFNTAMGKLESGLAGQPRPMREWGFDLSEATLKAKALELGITANVEKMNQGEKALIRYVQIFDTANRIGATGDFGRTINTAANQLRILKSSATLAARAIGNIFIPALNAVLPYAIAFLKVIRWLANELASLFGFSLPEVDYSGLQNVSMGAEDAGDALDDAAGSANDLKKALLGIDELNVISKDIGGSGNGNGGGSGFDIDLPDNTDWLSGVIDSKATRIFEQWKEKLEPVLNWAVENFDSIKSSVVAIGIGLLSWKLTTKLLNSLGMMDSSLAKIAAGVIVSVVGFTLEFQGSYEIGRGTAGIIDYIKTGLGAALGIGGGVLALTTAGLSAGAAFAITLPIALGVHIVGLMLGYKQSLIDDFWASEDGAELKSLSDDLSSKMIIVSDLQVQIDNIYGVIDSQTTEDFELAQNLIEEIFSMDGVENKTAAQIDEINQKIRTLNSLGLEGIQLDFDTTTGKVIGTRKEIENVLSTLKEQYRMEALREAYIEAYKAQFAAQQALNDVNEDSIGITSVYAGEVAELNRLESDLEDTKSAIFAIDQEYPNLLEKNGAARYENGKAILEERNSLQKYSAELVQQIQAQQAAVSESKAEWDKSRKAVDDAVSVYKNALTAVEDVSNAMDDQTTKMRDASNTADGMKDVGSRISEGFAKGIHDKMKAVDDAISAIADDPVKRVKKTLEIASPSKVFEEIGANVDAGFAAGLNGNTQQIAAAASRIVAEATDPVKRSVTQFSSYGKGLVGSLASGMSNNSGMLTQTTRTILNSLLSVFESFCGRLTNAFNQVLSATSAVSASTGGRSSYINLTPIQIPRLASGGIVQEGQMFIARESGPEMVGTIGGKTAVANNDQITDGIAAAVYKAIVDARGNDNGGDISVMVMLDGKQIEASLRAVKHRRGATIGTGGILNYA